MLLQRMDSTPLTTSKVRLNCYYYRHYYRGTKGLSSLIGLKCLMKDIEMIFATVLGRKIEFAGERF